MRFGEADIETSGCNAQGKIFYRKTARIRVKHICPTGKLRCCTFCNEACLLRCEMSEVLEHQPEGMRNRFVCIHLRPSLELAWKWLGSEK